MASVVPVFKGASESSNYHPISLLPVRKDGRTHAEAELFLYIDVLFQLAMYADDSSLYWTSTDPINTTHNEVGVSMDNDFENVLKWGHDWLVTFNAKKTKMLSMSLSPETGLSLRCT